MGGALALKKKPFDANLEGTYKYELLIDYNLLFTYFIYLM